ncbi:Crp/Fnr family transcriptional regulator (plasmid) [Ruegeria sp. SCSIO 43209]|uniref:Crp/Fnr family transcriptional regulator n=1 Tax=Ruegeria sp. SCSIO 43209 TaxID=2793010 RepID=UPI001CA93771|nr:Crp/Fnr family transcriptional regulator [Ruegeria sp. SCSIO 43209]UAB91020.1 Crp/Fnr family transcriptional regulator [Ruegeria sp. SCSIO 43209]
MNSLSNLCYAQGGHVFRQGDPTNGIFFIKSGNVCLTRVTESGNAVTIHNAQPGDMFAEASIYSDHYHCDAICSCSSEVVRVSKRAILLRLEDDSAFSEGITKRLAMQVQDYRQLLTLHAVKSANERVLLAVALGKLTGSVTQFASQIGLTKEACYRALKDLSEQGLLVKTGRGSYAPTPRGNDSHP